MKKVIERSAAVATLTGCVCIVRLYYLLGIFFVVLHFYLIIVASIKYHDCPGRRGFSFVVLYLGITLFFQSMIECCHQFGKRKPTQENGVSIQDDGCSLRKTVRCFLFIWSFVLCVYVFTFHPDAQQCDSLLYYSLFVYCIVYLFCSCLALVVISCSLLISWWFRRVSKPNVAENVV